MSHPSVFAAKGLQAHAFVETVSTSDIYKLRQLIRELRKYKEGQRRLSPGLRMEKKRSLALHLTIWHP